MMNVLALDKGRIGVTSGDYTGPIVIHCEEDGTIDITFADNTVESDYAMVAGDDRALRQQGYITINTGKFTIAKI